MDISVGRGKKRSDDTGEAKDAEEREDYEGKEHIY